MSVVKMLKDQKQSQSAFDSEAFCAYKSKLKRVSSKIDEWHV